jgi:uncharacterized protein (DUF305 family)
MTTTAARPEQETPAPVPRPRGRGLRTALLAVIAVALVVLGGGLAVGLGIGREPTADSVDAGFSRDMAVHHRQGVEMANLAPERSTDPEIRQIAFDISSTQMNQAGQMEGWLALWGLPRSGGEHMAWMGGAHASHDMSSMSGDTDGALMPGMATEAELANLRSLSGPAFDVEFLRLMIRHHQGGLEMAQYAAAHATEPAVRTLARSIADTQTAEVTTMVGMLTARGGTPLPAP